MKRDSLGIDKLAFMAHHLLLLRRLRLEREAMRLGKSVYLHSQLTIVTAPYPNESCPE